MSDTMVRCYLSSMSSAPTLNGTAGGLISVLDACLVTGFGTVTLTSLVVASNVATATVSGGHNFAMLGDNAIGPVIRIAGATPSALNGDWRITVTGSTTFTFATTNIDDQTATGTITAKRAPAGFTKTYSGTNLAAYRADDTGSGSNRFYFRVDDTNAQYGLVRGYESMSDINTGTNPFPTTTQISAANGRWMKSSSADSVARSWVLLADSRRFVLLPAWHQSHTVREFYIFGDTASYKTNDTFNTVCNMTIQSASSPGSYNSTLAPWSGSGLCFARDYTQNGTASWSQLIAPQPHSSYGYPIGYWSGAYLLPYPNSTDDSLILWGECELSDGTGNLRGKLPGFYVPGQKTPLSDLDVIANVVGLSNRALMAIKIVATNSSYEGRIFIDLTSWQS